MVTKGEENKVENKQAEEVQEEENGEKNEEENKAEGEKNEKREKAKEEADKRKADNEVDDTRNPTRLQEDETEIGDPNPADPNQAKWGYSDQEIRELESDKLIKYLIKRILNIFILVLGANFCNVGLTTFREVHMKSKNN